MFYSLFDRLENKNSRLSKIIKILNREFKQEQLIIENYSSILLTETGVVSCLKRCLK
jgi:hypothetical protein